MTKCSINQGLHAIGEIVFVEELLTMNLTIDKSVKVKYCGTAISRKDRLTRGTKIMDAHCFIRLNFLGRQYTVNKYGELTR